MEQGTINVIDFLLTEYAKSTALLSGRKFEDVVNELKNSGPLMAFRQFAVQYLDKNRPSAITHAEMNFVIQLMNMQRFSIAPDRRIVPGTMQSSGAIPITGRETAREMAMNATGMKGDMTPMGGPVDLSASMPAFSYDQAGPFQGPDRR